MNARLHKQIADIEKQFEDHMPTLEQHGPVTILEWRHPSGTNTFWVQYVLNGDALMAYGDLGEAVYRAHGGGGLRFWATTGLDYFHGKCEAAAKGERPHDWDEGAARAIVQDHWPEVLEEDPTTDRKLLAEALRATFSRAEWEAFLAFSEEEMFGPDYWEFCGAGNIVEDHCVAHWVGLRMAHTQLKMKKLADAAHEGKDAA